MILFRYFFTILIASSFLSACEKINEINIAELEALCSEYGYTSNSSNFNKCLKRQKIIAKYENENWFSRNLKR